MIYRIDFDKKARKQFRSLPQNERKKIWARIERLALNPRPYDTKKLKGHDGFYRIRSGDYRIVYKVEDGICLVLVVAIGNHKNIYENLLRN